MRFGTADDPRPTARGEATGGGWLAGWAGCESRCPPTGVEGRRGSGVRVPVAAEPRYSARSTPVRRLASAGGGSVEPALRASRTGWQWTAAAEGRSRSTSGSRRLPKWVLEKENSPNLTGREAPGEGH